MARQAGGLDIAKDIFACHELPVLRKLAGAQEDMSAASVLPPALPISRSPKLESADPVSPNQPTTMTGSYPRLVTDRLAGALDNSPAVVIHGPRQIDKATLPQHVGGPAGYTYLSFDDEAIRSVATVDRAGFVADLPRRVILDEVQHVPKPARPLYEEAAAPESRPWRESAVPAGRRLAQRGHSGLPS